MEFKEFREFREFHDISANSPFVLFSPGSGLIDYVMPLL
jgi:hypothetical protein